ncbi:hypothetical protein BGZ73_000063 [Actinomortierella ambigua]|nr:hypothetical protein BGZ73_000063 [Actinomortierella ambigua]
MSMASRPMSRRSTLDARDSAPPPHISTSSLQHASSALPHSQQTPVAMATSSALPTTTPTTATSPPSRTPSLPLVVIKAQKPSSIQEIRDGALLMARGATTSTTTTIPTAAATSTGGSHRRPSIDSHHYTPQEDIPPRVASSIAALATPSSPTPSHHDTTQSPSASSSSLLTSFSPAAIQTRTIHPQVHYVFADDDPHASNLLSQLPKERTISLHLDPATGRISEVDSFIPEFQIMSVRAIPVPSPTTPSSNLQTSASSSSSLSGGSGGGGGIATAATNTPGTNAVSSLSSAPAQTTAALLQGPPSSSSSSIAHHNLASSTILGQTKAARGQLSTNTGASSGNSGLNSAATGTTGSSAMSRQASLKDASSMAEPSVPHSSSSLSSSQPVYRDWTLVIEGVETDPHPERGRPGYYCDTASGNELQFMEDSAQMSDSRRGGRTGGSDGGDGAISTIDSADSMDDAGHPMGGEAPVSKPMVLKAIGFHTEQDHETQQVNLILNDDYLDDCDAILASFGAR